MNLDDRCADQCDHTTPLFKKLGLLKVENIHRQQILIVMYKFSRKQLPNNFCRVEGGKLNRLPVATGEQSPGKMVGLLGSVMSSEALLVGIARRMALIILSHYTI